MTGFIHAWYEPHNAVGDNSTGHMDLHEVQRQFIHFIDSYHLGEIVQDESRLQILVTPYSFLYAEYAAATVLVTFCVLLGKVK